MKRLTTPRVSLVVPNKNGARTLPRLLSAASALLRRGLLQEIILVDDGSTDDSPRAIEPWSEQTRLAQTGGRGPAAARNVGWRLAGGDWVWFIDADCVPDAESLETLLRIAREEEPDLNACDLGRAVGIGGGYTNLQPHSLLARWIQAEIAARHALMPRYVDFLGSFNVIYHRRALSEVGGFDEQNFPHPSAEDNDLAYRLRARGYRLRFEATSTVGHFHPTRWRRYLRTQARHGYYRMVLYLRHPTQMAGDSYSGVVDHAQPLLALALAPGLVLSLGMKSLTPVGLVMALLCLSACPMTWRVFQRERRAIDLGFCGLSLARALARAAGLALGLADAGRERLWRGVKHCIGPKQVEARSANE